MAAPVEMLSDLREVAFLGGSPNGGTGVRTVRHLAAMPSASGA